MNASPTVPPCYHISLTAKEFLHFQHPKLLMSSVATSSMYVCTTADLVHPLKLGIDQEKTSWKENQGHKRTASGWPTDFESDWEEVILLNDWVKAHTSTYYCVYTCGCMYVHAKIKRKDFFFILSAGFFQKTQKFRLSSTLYLIILQLQSHNIYIKI